MRDTNQVDYQAIRRYFAQTDEGKAACASYMAHAQDLPENAVNYRFAKERATIHEWLDAVDRQARGSCFPPPSKRLLVIERMGFDEALERAG